MSRVLVTGGCGFIASNYINRSLSTKRYSLIVNIDKLDIAGSESNITDPGDGSYIFIRGDMDNEDLVFNTLSKYRIDVVIHASAYSHVDKSFENPISFSQNNILGTHHLLEACRRYRKLKKILIVSTDEVYGFVDDDNRGCCENMVPRPTNPYSASKIAADMIASAYFFSYNLPIVTIRPNNVYGINQYPEKLIPRFIMLLKRGDKVTIHGNGSTRRNFLHTDDISKAFDIIIDHGELGQIYNAGTEDEYSVLDIAKILIKGIKGNDANLNDWIEYIPDRLFNDSLYRVNSSKLRSLGWVPEASFSEKLSELYK